MAISMNEGNKPVVTAGYRDYRKKVYLECLEDARQVHPNGSDELVFHLAVALMDKSLQNRYYWEDAKVKEVKS